jgi:tripartite-type tricarboxylate transporter receptor subunit TctC
MGQFLREKAGMDRREFMAGCAGLSLAVRAGDARGQSGPLTKIIFPFAAGGSGDTLCRLLAQNISQPLDRTIIVEDRNGGDGLIGIKSVKGANPDGTTILVTTGPTMFLLPMVETKPSFDRDRDFMPVSLLTRFEFCIAIGPLLTQRILPAWSPGSRQIQARRRSACRAMGPFRILPVPGSRKY